MNTVQIIWGHFYKIGKRQINKNLYVANPYFLINNKYKHHKDLANSSKDTHGL